MFDHLDQFAGRPVQDVVLGEEFPISGPAIPRLRIDYDSTETISDLFRQLLEQEDSDQLTGLVIGAWAGEDLYEATSAEMVESLVAAADQLPNLKALFVGDIAQEENEVSWIHQSDLSPLWTAFPRLEVLGIRGANELSLGKIRHNHLKSLTIETGGLGRSIVQQIAAASLPALEHLEIYLGTDNYGWDGTIDDVRPLLNPALFPRLKYLGLRNSQIADEIAVAVADAPILDQLDTLDLSLGTLGDVGAVALLAAPRVKKLKRLLLNHHYMSDAVMKRFAGLGPEVDISDQEDEGEYGRYVSVSE